MKSAFFGKYIFLIFITHSVLAQATVPFLDMYPKIASSVPHVSLGTYPTPLLKVEELGKNLGIGNLYVKDDGYVGDIKVPRGNKERKLEYLLADAQKKGIKTVCTVGSAGSNHALQTAICAKALGMKTVLVLDDQLQTSVVIRNLKLMAYFDAKIIYAPPCYDTNEALEQHAQDICNEHGYYFIPIGGSNELGVLGYINAVFELKKQLKDMGLKDPDVVYVTLGSTGTAAGIIIGAAIAGLKSKIIPVRISYTPEYKSKFLGDLINKTYAYIKTIDDKCPVQQVKLIGTQIEYPGLEVEINHDYVGDGYAAITEKAAAAISLFYNATGKKLEPTYTGKTLSALVDDARKGLLKDKMVLFWNTFSYGTFEELINQVSDEKIKSCIPQEFMHYLTDPLQPNEQQA